MSESESGLGWLGEDAIKVLAAMADLPDASGGSDHKKVMHESGLQGIDFNHGVGKLLKGDGDPLVVRVHDYLKMTPAGLQLVKDNKEYLKTVVEKIKTEQEVEVASDSSAFN